jgi:hypothetical protein
MWGLVIGVAQAATPLAFWWLDTATVYTLGLVVIASVYIGFAVADGRRTVLAVESGVAGMFVIVAAAAIRSSRTFARRAHSLLTEGEREVGADADGCVSSIAGVGPASYGKPRLRPRAVSP